MAFTVTHTTAADGTFSGSGATAWNAAHSLSGQVPAANGGTGFDGSAAANGQLPIGNGSGFTLANLTAGSNVTITNSAGGISIAASSGTNSGPTFPGGIPLTGVKYATAYNMSVSTGNTDLYTVPANKRAILFDMSLMNNSGVGNIVWFPEVGISASYYRMGSNSTTTNGAQGISQTIGYIAEAGETISINTATNNGAAVFARVIEFDNTCALFSSKLTSFSVGDNTVYTVTTGKTAILLSNNLGQAVALSGTGNFSNNSGGARTISWKFQPSGGSVTVVNPGASKADATKSSDNITFSASSGDKVIVNTDATTAGQLAWVNAMEI